MAAEPASDLYYPNLVGVDPKIADAIRILFDAIYALGGRKGQDIFLEDNVRVERNLHLFNVGSGLRIREDGVLTTADNQVVLNATMGVAKLGTGATVTVPCKKVTLNSRIFLSAQDDTGANDGVLTITNRVPGESFEIDSSKNPDRRVVAWLLIEPL